MRLRPGCAEAYQQAHDQLWEEVAASMQNNRVSMAIFRTGDRLFVVATAPTEADWLASRDNDALEDWNAQMTQFLETDSQGNIAFEPLEQVFGFGDLS